MEYYYKNFITQGIFLINIITSISAVSSVCDCNQLSTCLQRAWSPCTAAGGNEELFWMRLHPGHWRFTRCKWEWRQVQLMDFTFRHTKAIMKCLSSHNTCQAAVNLKDNLVNNNKKDGETKCFNNAAICHYTLGRKCQTFRSEVAWNDCWINNADIAPDLREAVVSAWRCEVQKDLEVDPIQSLNDFIAPLKPSANAEQLQSKRRSNYWDCERFARALGYRIHLECGSLRSIPFKQ